MYRGTLSQVCLLNLIVRLSYYWIWLVLFGTIFCADEYSGILWTGVA